MLIARLIPVSLVAAVALLLLATQGRGERFCGARLTEELQRICTDGFNHHRTIKRTGEGDGEPATSVAVAETLPSIAWQWPDSGAVWLNQWFAANQAPMMVRQSPRRVVRGVVEECCRKPCTKTHLREYCL